MAESRSHDSLEAEALLERYRQRGDVVAIGVLFDREAPGLYRLALSIVGEPAAAEDVLQETFLAALDSVDRFEAGRPVGPWLVGILKNMARRAGRARHRRPDPDRLPVANGASAPTLDQEDREALRRAIDALPEPYRAAALLRFVHGLPTAEIAHLRSEPPGTTRSQLSRARKLLRRRMQAAPAFLLVPDGVRGLEAVRTVVLEHAATFAPAAATALGVGGILMAKKTLLLGVAALLLLLGSGLGLGLALRRPATSVPTRVQGTSDPVAERPTLRGSPVEANGGTSNGVRAVAGPHTSGTVRDARGRPIAGAGVLAVPQAERCPLGTEEVASGAAGTTAQSDDTGRFHVPLDAAHPSHTLLVEAAGFAPRALRGVRPGQHVEVVLEPAALIIGRVTDAQDRPIGGATVRFLGALDTVQVVRRTVSDAEGRYRIADLPEKTPTLPDAAFLRAWILAEADGYAPLMLEYARGGPELEAGAECRIDLGLVRGAVVAGRVTDAETGRPLAGADVLAVSIEGMVMMSWGAGRESKNPWAPRVLGRTKADDDGCYVYAHFPAAGIHTPASHNSMGGGRRCVGTLYATVPGYVTHGENVPVVADAKTIPLEIALWPAAGVRGRIVDISGRPMDDVHVWVSADEREVRLPPLDLAIERSPGPWTEVDGQGRFTLTGVPAPRAARAPAKLHVGRRRPPSGYERIDPMEIEVRAGEVLDLDDVVFETQEDFVRHAVEVRGSDGHPIAGAVIGRTFQTRWPVRTDAAGRAVLHFRVLPNRKLTPQPRVATADGFAPHWFEIDPEGPATTEIVLQPGRTIRGRVEGEDGSPRPGVWVQAAMPDRPIEEVFPHPPTSPGVAPRKWTRIVAVAGTREDGSFVLRDLPPGSVHVLAEVQEWIGNKCQVSRTLAAAVETGRTGLELTLPPLGVETVAVEVEVVVGKEDAPVDAASLVLAKSRRQFRAGRSGRGRYRFDAVVAGTYTLTVSCPGLVPVRREGVMVTETPSDQPLLVRMTRGARIEGRVKVGPDAGDIAGRQLTAIPFDRRGYTDVVSGGVLGPDGRFVLAGLRPGRWFVRLVATDMTPKDAPRVARASVAPLEVRGEGLLEMDLHFVVGGVLKIHIADDRLPSAPWEPDSAQAHAYDTYGRAGQLSVLSREGVVVGASRGVYNGGWSTWLSEVPLPAGTYRVRLALPHADPLEATAVVEQAGQTTVRIGRRP